MGAAKNSTERLYFELLERLKLRAAGWDCGTFVDALADALSGRLHAGFVLGDGRMDGGGVSSGMICDGVVDNGTARYGVACWRCRGRVRRGVRRADFGGDFLVSTLEDPGLAVTGYASRAQRSLWEPGRQDTRPGWRPTHRLPERRPYRYPCRDSREAISRRNRIVALGQIRDQSSPLSRRCTRQESRRAAVDGLEGRLHLRQRSLGNVNRVTGRCDAAQDAGVELADFAQRAIESFGDEGHVRGRFQLDGFVFDRRASNCTSSRP